MQTTHYIKPGTPEHQKLITASKIPAILGVDNFTTPAKLWLQMTGTIGPEPTNNAMRRGHIQEPSILEWFYQIEHPELTRVAGETTWTNPNYPWAAANTDSHATTPDGGTVFIEAKSVARPNHTWGKPGTDQVPEKVWAQVQFQRWVADHINAPNITTTYVIKHGPYVDQYDTYEVPYNPTAAAEIARRAKHFHDSLTDPHGCPPPTEAKNEHRWFAQAHPDINPNTHWDISYDMAAEYINARENQDQATKRMDKAKADILKAIGTARTATHNGHTIAYRRATKNSVSLYPPTRAVTIDDLTTNK